MAGYDFGKGLIASSYYHYYTHDGSSTTDQTISHTNQRFRVENEMTYEWEPRMREVKIERPTKAFMEYTRDLGLDAEFIKKLKSDVLKMRIDKELKFDSLEKIEENIEEVKCQTELMFDPQNLDV